MVGLLPFPIQGQITLSCETKYRKQPGMNTKIVAGLADACNADRRGCQWTRQGCKTLTLPARATDQVNTVTPGTSGPEEDTVGAIGVNAATGATGLEDAATGATDATGATGLEGVASTGAGGESTGTTGATGTAEVSARPQAPTPTPSPCTNKRDSAWCSARKQEGKCETAALTRALCRKTCGLCTSPTSSPSTTPAPGPANPNPLATTAAPTTAAPTPTTTTAARPQAPTPTPSPCTNTRDSAWCSARKQEGKCETAALTRALCWKTCGLCTSPTSSPSTTLAP